MHTHKYPVWLLFLSGLFGLFLAGCTTRLGDSIHIPMGELALYESTPKAKSIAHLEENIREAKKDNMPFLAPHYFREASDILNSAQQSSPNKVSAEQLAKADTLIDRGQAIIVIVKKTFARELELKALLEKSTANEIYPREYEAIIYKLSGLIEKVELDRARNIERDKEELNRGMQELYIKTVQHNSLHESPKINQDPNSKDDER